MYRVVYSNFMKEYQVVSLISGLAQSAWKKLAESNNTAYNLNCRR